MNRINEKTALCSDPILRDYLEKEGIKAYVFDSFFSQEEKMKMLEDLDRFACFWFLDEKGNDYTLYREVSIGASLHDELMNFFHLLVHFIFLMDRIMRSGGELIFYQSDSCEMPACILELIQMCGGRVIIRNYKYPYLSYRKIFRQQIGTTYSYISYFFRGEDNSGVRRKLKGGRPMLREFFSRFASSIFSPKKGKFIHLYIMRNLVSFYKEYLKEPNPDYGLILSHASLSEPSPDRKKKGVISEVAHLIRLARKGVTIEALMPSPFYGWKRSYKKQEACLKLVKDFERNFGYSFNKYFRKIENKVLFEFLKKVFHDFYIDNLPQFLRVIDFYYKKFSDHRIKVALQEFVHPFQAQVMARLQKYCFLSPVNPIVHNQYCTPVLFSRTTPFFKVIAVSEYDATRYKKLGFDAGDIGILDTGLITKLRNQIEPFRMLKSVRNTKVLILPLFVPNLHTYKYQIESSYLINYLFDVLCVLEELGVSDAKIRPHPGGGVYNQFGYTERDFYKGILDFYQREWKININISDSYYHNLIEDIHWCDLVVGSISACMLQVLNSGRDYVIFDRRTAPSWGSKDCSVFSENDGVVKCLKNRDELYNHLMDYFPLNRALFFKKYFDNTSKAGELEGELNRLMQKGDSVK